MTEFSQNFTPDWISPPGDTIADLIEEREWTQVDLAKRLGFTKKHVSQLINGKAPITEETALKLESVLGSTVGFWLSREAQYRAKLAQRDSLAEFQQWVTWLDALPVKDLMKQGVIPKLPIIPKNKPSIVRDLLRFFGVASPDDWSAYYGQMQVSFRRTQTDQDNVGAISAWLRQGEIVAEQQSCPKYNKASFQRAVRKIRQFTRMPSEEFLPLMKQHCGEAGVVLILVPAIPRARTSGVARWLNANKALIQLSLYGKSNDRFWFTFFHEAAHILLHGKQEIFLDEWDQSKQIPSDQEREADTWSNEFLIPLEYQSELQYLHTKRDVQEFADRLNLHPGIVVGRLQHDGLIEMRWMNDFKERLDCQTLLP
jgi:HTH-type transcriptional regulator / antitoxin HigA